MSKSFDYSAAIMAADAWHDITDYVYGHDRADIHINMSRSEQSASWQSSTCDLQLNNRDGRFSEYNSVGPYYGYLGVNTLLRIQRDLAWSTFGTAAASSWSAAVTGDSATTLAWTTFGSGGAINASDYNVAAGKGTHSVPAANAYRSTYLAGAQFSNTDVYCDLSMDTTNITGAAVSWNILFRGKSTSDYWRMCIEVQTDETVRIRLFDDNGNDISTGPTVTGVTHSSSQTLHVRVLVADEAMWCKVWTGADEPFNFSAQFSVGTTDTSTGWIGLQSRRNTSNSNGTIVFSYDNFYIKSNRFLGEVAEWPNEWDTTGVDVFCNITASSQMRRIGNMNAPITSPVRAGITAMAASVESVPIRLLTYVPLEEGSQALYGAPDVGPYKVVLTGNTRAPNQHWGKGDLLPWLYNGIALYGDGQLSCAINQTGFIGTDGWRVDYVIKNAADVDWTIRIESGSFTWLILVKPSTKQFNVTYPTGNITTDVPAFFDNSAHSLKFECYQAGATISWGLYVDGTLYMGGIPAGTLQALSHWRIDSTALHTGAISVSHAAAWSAAFSASNDIETSITGYLDERTTTRLQRMVNDPTIGINVFAMGSPDLTAKLGPQSLAQFGSQLDDAEKTDMGFLRDQRGITGINYRSLSTLLNQTAKVTFSYTSSHLVQPMRIVNDDQYIKNDVTATSSGGGRYRYEVATGPKSTASPETGAPGRYTDQQSYNVANDDQLQDIATWQAHLGTVDEPRIPEVCINLDRSQITRQLLFSLMELDIGDRFDITDIPINKGYGATSAAQLVIGYEEVINHFISEIRLKPVPESPYEIIRMDDTNVSRTQAGNSYIAENITDSATSMVVKSLDNTRWTNLAASLPIPIRIGGEDMSVTAVTNKVPSFVGAGTAAHADNASVTPTIHGSATTNDLMIIMAAIRNTAATPTLPVGWTLLYADGNVRFFGKVHSGVESNPVVSFTGGAAGDTTSAQVAAFRNIGLTVYQSFSGTNGSAQNIGFGSLNCPMVDGLGIIWGWKQDDWTSVATVDAFGWAEIGEPSSTTGNDQGIVWDYKIFDGDVLAPDGNLIVTGGASAISKGGAFAMGNWQTFTVSRAQNGTPAKAHLANDTERARIRARGRTTVGLYRNFIF